MQNRVYDVRVRSPGVPVVTIDGPSGVGKGTVARDLAAYLGWHYLDSGSLYRITALKVMQQQIPLEETTQVAAVALGLDVRFSVVIGQEPRVWLDGVDVTEAIRTEACGIMASKVAAIAAVRAGLLDRQRSFAQPPGLVTDGRDMGTVVFPEAAVKCFLTASAETRAERRLKQLQAKNVCVNISSILQDIQERDARDQSRAVAPLVPAKDAVVIETDTLSREAVFEHVLQQVIHHHGPFVVKGS